MLSAHRLSGLSLCLSFWADWSSSMVCPEPFCGEPVSSSSWELSESSSEEEDDDEDALCCVGGKKEDETTAKDRGQFSLILANH